MTDGTTGAGGLEERIERSKRLGSGAGDYRAYVGPPTQYDFMGATQFRLLTGLGLREEHRVVDIGCGSLRAGRFLLQYLMPGRYAGVEPNDWLWRTALAEEIGADVERLKQPRFSADETFELPGIETGWADAVVAQSIYSHTGADLFARSLAAVERVLAPKGQALFTVILPECPGFEKMERAVQVEGWHYPQCVTFLEAEVAEHAAAAGLHAQRLRWFHPRQVWYRATRDAGAALTAEMEQALGTGRPLFDSRFG